MKKVVLAYSGGLDTSFCVKYLTKELGYEVYTALANTGGFSAEELAAVEKRAYALGAKQHVNIDVTGDYYSKCIKYMVFGNVLRNKTYPISVSSERTFQALAIVNYAKSIGADAVAHGSTGAGNDQVRFDLTFEVFAPQMEIITPTRDMKLTREYSEGERFRGRLHQDAVLDQQGCVGHVGRRQGDIVLGYEPARRGVPLAVAEAGLGAARDRVRVRRGRRRERCCDERG